MTKNVTIFIHTGGSFFYSLKKLLKFEKIIYLKYHLDAIYGL